MANFTSEQQAQRFEADVKDVRKKTVTHTRGSTTLQRQLDSTKEKLHMKEVQIVELTDQLKQTTDQLKNVEYKATRLQTKLDLALVSVDVLLSMPREKHDDEIDHLGPTPAEPKVVASQQEGEELSMMRAAFNQLEASYAQVEFQLEMERFRVAQLSNELAQSKHETEAAEQDFNDLLPRIDNYDQMLGESIRIEAELRMNLEVVGREADEWRLLAQRFEDEVKDAREKTAVHSRDSSIDKEHDLGSEIFRSEFLDLESGLLVIKSIYSTASTSSSADQNEADIAHESLLSSLIDENPFVPSLSLERDMEESGEHIQNLQDELRELGDRLQEEQDRRAELEAHMIEMNDRHAHMEAMEVEISDMTAELIRKTEQVKNAEYEVTYFQTQFEFARESAVELLSSQQEQHNVKVGLLGQELAESKVVASQQLSMLRAEFTQLEASYEAQLDVERAHFAQLSGELAKSKHASEAAEQKLDELRQQLDLGQKEHDDTARQSQKQANYAAGSMSIDGSANDMAQKYPQEHKCNAALFSRLQSATGNMKVPCRMRPHLAHDRSERRPWRP
ncbi:Aste57867_20280 [Aphanomyces stellatus]|uniref:Aste57867_20280 protein n=1 Tax=Aphanomyces stellatus TaxID=120398 RepID=A0A485LER7_9STRA|nr:hypothetical protein As57867_020214 [Aphanomyces stellatus]VFT96970.1 Aste57867_20280 [Aphanomyces stellatus]